MSDEHAIQKQATEIAELKAEFNALRSRYERILSGTNGVWEWLDIESNQERWSPRFYTILGYEPGEIEASLDTFTDLLHPDDRERTMQLVQRHFADEKVPFDIEYRLKTRAGDYKWIRAIGEAERDSSGMPLSMAGIIVDIDQQKKAFAKIAALNHAMEHAFEGVAFIEKNGRYSYVNQAFADLQGYEVNELIQTKTWRDLVYPEDQPLKEAAYETMRKLGKAQVLVRGIRKDESLFYKQVTLVRQHDESGDFIGHHCFIRDVSEEYYTKQHLELSNRELEQFAFSAAHDLRTPLRGIQSLAAWINDDDENQLSAATMSYLQKIDQRIIRMDNFINGLLELSCISKTELNHLNFSTIELTTFLPTLFQQIPGSEFFELAFANELPTIHASKRLLHQVFSHLFENAITHHHKKHGTIIVKCNPELDAYRFCVQDDGPGVLPEYADKIFDLFQTLQTKDRKGTTGIGLTLVKKIIELQHGRIWLDKQYQAGCEICFTWPKR